MEREQGVGVWKVERPLAQSGTKQLEFTILFIGGRFLQNHVYGAVAPSIYIRKSWGLS